METIKLMKSATDMKVSAYLGDVPIPGLIQATLIMCPNEVPTVRLTFSTTLRESDIIGNFNYTTEMYSNLFHVIKVVNDSGTIKFVIHEDWLFELKYPFLVKMYTCVHSANNVDTYTRVRARDVYTLRTSVKMAIAHNEIRNL
jgi:hypothetical protein